MNVKGSTEMATPATTTIGEKEISDSYIYLLGRLAVTRQQQLDFKEGFNWNELVHRKPGAYFPAAIQKVN